MKKLFAAVIFFTVMLTDICSQTYEPLPEDIIRLITGRSYKENTLLAYSELAYLTIRYINFSGEDCVGHMITAAGIAEEVSDIFEELYEKKYPIFQIRLIDFYNADDNLSMEDNNTSAFNFRYITNSTRISMHGYGVAIDINPVQNPYVINNTVLPASGRRYLDRTNVRQGMIVRGDACYQAFIRRGWTWGGNWNSPRDYQHFEKDSR